MCLWVPLAILDKAASGSPWLPVHNRHTLLGLNWLASSADINILLSYIYPHFIANSIDFYILQPNRAIFLLLFLQVSTMCLSLYIFEANVANIILLFL